MKPWSKECMAGKAFYKFSLEIRKHVDEERYSLWYAEKCAEKNCNLSAVWIRPRELALAFSSH
jgi:hypothetical protein